MLEAADGGSCFSSPVCLFRLGESRSRLVKKAPRGVIIVTGARGYPGQRVGATFNRSIGETVDQGDDLSRVAEAFRRGEVWAFRRVAEQFFGPIVNFLSHLLGNVDLAQDLAQEAFFAAYRSHRTLREGSPLAPWIFQIARNLAYRELRDQTRNPKSSLEELTERDGFEPRVHEASPHERSVDRDLSERVYRALRKIKPDFRDAVILRLVQGYSGRETASLLGVPVATVNTRVHRGIRELRKVLRREGIDESILL